MFSATFRKLFLKLKRALKDNTFLAQLTPAMTDSSCCEQLLFRANVKPLLKRADYTSNSFQIEFPSFADHAIRTQFDFILIELSLVVSIQTISISVTQFAGPFIGRT